MIFQGISVARNYPVELYKSFVECPCQIRDVCSFEDIGQYCFHAKPFKCT